MSVAAGAPARRPLRRALAWLAFLGPFFFASYGFANWLASTRAHVGSIVYAWELHIPFLPWTIVPYWSIDALYVVSLFVCTTRRELDRHARRLLFVQLVCIAFFIAVPLRFTFTHPPASGIFGALFTALGSFDKPFNQAPSLHIALLVLIWDRLQAHVRAAHWRWLLHAWMTLIGLSILTTYQHHFIDLPTGLAVGLVATFDVSLDVARTRSRWTLASYYAIGAILFGAIHWWWPALALLLVASNYAFFGARGFQKRADGRVPLAALILYAPYQLGAYINSRSWTRRHAIPNEIADGVFLGRIPFSRTPFDAIVDMVAELPCPAAQHVRFYRSIPCLDLITVSNDDLRAAAAAIEEARAHGRVLVFCALGFSRSASAVVAWLRSTGRAASLDDAIAIVRRARPAIRVKRVRSFLPS